MVARLDGKSFLQYGSIVRSQNAGYFCTVTGFKIQRCYGPDASTAHKQNP